MKYSVTFFLLLRCVLNQVGELIVVPRFRLKQCPRCFQLLSHLDLKTVFFRWFTLHLVANFFQVFRSIFGDGQKSSIRKCSKKILYSEIFSTLTEKQIIQSWRFCRNVSSIYHAELWLVDSVQSNPQLHKPIENK